MNYAIYLKNHSVILVIVVLHTWVMQYSTMVKGCPIAGMVLHADPLMALHADPLMALQAELKLVKINYLTKQLHQNSSNTNQQKS